MQLDNITTEATEEMNSRELGTLHKRCHAWRDNGIVYENAKRVHDLVAAKLVEYGINHKSALKPQADIPDRGLYLVPPHGKLIADGRKTAIVNKARLNLTGRWVLVSGKQAFGVITVGEPEGTLPDVFAERFQEHRVREKEREKWWPDRQTLYLYEIKEFEPFKDGPLAVQVPAGVHFNMGNVKLDEAAMTTALQEPQKPQQKMRTDNILEQLSDLPEKFVWVPDFVSLTGSTIYAKSREPNDVDVVLRAEKSGNQFELRLPVDAGFALKLERVLKDALKIENVQYTGNQYGPNWKSLPLYNLCLVKVPKLEYRELDEAEFAKQQYKELKGGAGSGWFAPPKGSHTAENRPFSKAINEFDVSGKLAQRLGRIEAVIPDQHLQELEVGFYELEFGRGSYKKGKLILHPKKVTGHTVAHELGHHAWDKIASARLKAEAYSSWQRAKESHFSKPALAKLGLTESALEGRTEFFADVYAVAMSSRLNSDTGIWERFADNRDFASFAHNFEEGIFGGDLLGYKEISEAKESELKGGAGSGWFGPPKGTHVALPHGKTTRGGINKQQATQLRKELKSWKGTRQDIALDAIKWAASGQDLVEFRKSGELVGIASITSEPHKKLGFPPGKYREVICLATKEKGQGRRAMATMAQSAANEGSGLILLSTPRSKGFYEHLGMNETGRGFFYWSASECRDFAGTKERTVEFEPDDGIFVAPWGEWKREKVAKTAKLHQIEPMSAEVLDRLLRGADASTRRQAKAGSDEDLDAVLTRSRKRKAPQKSRQDDENGTVEHLLVESDNLTSADKARPSRTRCMKCNKSPVVDVHWADGRGRAWFCLKCFKEWVAEDDREIVRAWFLPDGTVPKEIGKSPSVQIRKLGEGLSSSKIVARLEKLLSAAKSTETTSDGKVKNKDDVAVAASVLLADKALEDYPDESVKLRYVAQSHSRDKSSHLDLRFEYKRGSTNYLRGWTVTRQPGPGEPIPAGMTREFLDVSDIVVKGECGWGVQKPWFNEWFLDGNWKGRWTFRLVQREGEKFYLIETDEECKALMEQLRLTNEDLKSLPMLTKQDVLAPSEGEQSRKGAYWILLQPLSQQPYVLGKEAVSKDWLPPKTVSCLPRKMRASVPKNLQYWTMDRENALEARRELAGKEFGETELKGDTNGGLSNLPDNDLAELHTLTWNAGAVEAVKAVEDELVEREKARRGRGHWGHAGIPGYQGGSLPGSGGTWSHHGGKREPVEYTVSASHARRKMLQAGRQYNKKVDRAREQWEKAAEVWNENNNERARISKEWWAASLASDVEQVRKLDPQLDRAIARTRSSSETTANYHGTWQNLMQRQAEEARAHLKVENPASFDVNFGRLRKGKESVQEGAEVFADLVGTGTLDGRTVNVKRPTLYSGQRAYYSGGAIHMPTRTGPRTTVHELGHWLEDRDSKIHSQALTFLRGRTKGESARRLSTITGDRGYKSHETSRRDKFIHPYMGKDYGTGATEIISMGLEYMAYEPVKFAQQDPEYFDFMYDLMRGR